jgi:hypothetical protein
MRCQLADQREGPQLARASICCAIAKGSIIFTGRVFDFSEQKVLKPRYRCWQYETLDLDGGANSDDALSFQSLELGDGRVAGGFKESTHDYER